MVKQWGFSILTLGFIFLYTSWGQLSASHQTINVNPLVQAFQAGNLQVETWMIHHGAPLEQPLTDQQVKRLTRYFRLTEQHPSFQSTPNSSQSERIFFSNWLRNIPLEIRVIRRGHERNVFADDYLVVKVKAVGQDPRSLTEAVNDVSDGLQQAGIKPNIHVSIQGTAPNILRQNEQQQLIHRVMENLDAHEVEALRDATATSVSAFSPHLGKPLVSDGQEMNVQIAVRTDQVTKRTVITMGTPIITIEY